MHLVAHAGLVVVEGDVGSLVAGHSDVGAPLAGLRVLRNADDLPAGRGQHLLLGEVLGLTPPDDAVVDELMHRHANPLAFHCRVQVSASVSGVSGKGNSSWES